MTLLDHLDPRLQPALRAELERRRGQRVEPLPRGVTVVLAGQRAAGKSRLLPLVAQRLGRPGVELDAALEERHGRPLKAWLEADGPGFREAERALFRELPQGLVVAVGGGFLSLHAEVLRGLLVVEVPVSFETYRERLRADATRPRLRPELPVEAELREVYDERERLHRAARPMSVVDFLLRLERGWRARRVVTLPPGEALAPFAWRAFHAGAELLEVRGDLHPKESDLLPASRALPLLVAERGAPSPPAWRARASFIDVERSSAGAGPGGPGVAHGWRGLVSFHASLPLTTAAALAGWAECAPGVQVKHVEPLEAPAHLATLLETQAALRARFGDERVTVLATGPLATAARAVLAEHNTLDYLALDSAWAAAPGQRLLGDARRAALHRAAEGTSRRLGILGAGLAHSRSPRVHRQPFDRLDLPADAPLAALLQSLHPHYRGFAVTNPFKRVAAQAVGAAGAAVNTLVRTARGWRGENTDVAGARLTLEVLGARAVTVLGDGGVTVALREAAEAMGVALEVRPRGAPAGGPLDGAVVWTWPAQVDPPAWLAFAPGARVAVVAYGPPGRSIASAIRARGGTPLELGHRWFVAQARAQRQLWESAA